MYNIRIGIREIKYRIIIFITSCGLVSFSNILFFMLKLYFIIYLQNVMYTNILQLQLFKEYR